MSHYSHTKFIRRAIASMDVKLIALHHNVPNMNNRIAKAHNPILKKVFQFVSALNLRLVYCKCDAYVVLSECFKRIFTDFTKVRDASKLHAISNPLTLPPLPPREKKNAILYVGRLEETQKRVSRVIEVWKMLFNRFPDWRLDVIGDGPDRASVIVLPGVEMCSGSVAGVGSVVARSVGMNEVVAGNPAKKVSVFDLSGGGG